MDHLDPRNDLVDLDEATAEAFDDNAMEGARGSGHEVHHDLPRNTVEDDADKDHQEGGHGVLHGDVEGNVLLDWKAFGRTVGNIRLVQTTTMAEY